MFSRVRRSREGIHLTDHVAREQGTPCRDGEQPTSEPDRFWFRWSLLSWRHECQKGSRGGSGSMFCPWSRCALLFGEAANWSYSADHGRWRIYSRHMRTSRTHVTCTVSPTHHPVGLHISIMPRHPLWQEGKTREGHPYQRGEGRGNARAAPRPAPRAWLVISSRVPRALLNLTSLVHVLIRQAGHLSKNSTALIATTTACSGIRRCGCPHGLDAGVRQARGGQGGSGNPHVLALQQHSC